MVTTNSIELDCKFLDEKKTTVEGLPPQSTLPNKIPTSGFALPIIDLSAPRELVVEKVKDAVEKWGFFQVINHGVPLSILEDVKDGVVRFHDEDPEVKKSYFTQDLTKKFIYHNNFELFSSSKSGNWRDSFACYVAPPELPNPEDLPLVCRDGLFEFSKHVISLGDLLFELFSEALGLGSEMLKSKGCMKGVLLAGNYYPPCPKPDLKFGTKKHSDHSFMTILLQDQTGGLQALHQDTWVDVWPIPGAIVINIGDYLQLMTNDKFKSVEHRVLVNRDAPRISVTCFVTTLMNPNPTVYGPIKELLSEENPPKYREITIPEYTKGYIERGIDGDSHLSYYRI
ncbi:hypothetical protein AALP_AA1G038100 [Arabis alpina]|uniref:Fe2OG dioxygenase domain-containing protein n=1 Tax=Arabis alpina TaxID=50452 RepID=A0A087HKX5_ARAAL|nr:hypothetical protein AALP_AA1G038100 [Arabis alpina]